MARHTSDERAKVVVLLEESAAANAGTPRWATVEAKCGIPRDTLRRWWAKRGEARSATSKRGELRVLPKPDERQAPETPRATSSAAHMEPHEFYAMMLGRVDEDAEAARESSPTSLPPIRKLQVELYEKLRAATSLTRDGRALTPEEQAQKIRTLIAGLTPRLQVVAAEELKRRGLAS